MAVLEQLCRHAGDVVSAERLLQSCWPGETLGDNPVHKSIAALRQAFGDSARESRYIETIRKQGYRLLAPVRWLSGQGPLAHAGSWRGRSPFRGLAAFDGAHADVFFGRETMVVELRRRLQSLWQQGEPLLLLLGPSGSGKSSLVQAGLLPSLRNAATALLFLRGSHGDLNIRGAFLHMAADALVSLGVVLAGALYLWRGWAWIDPVLSLVIAVVIVLGTWGLLRQSVHLLFDGVPEGIDLGAVRRGLLGLPGVAGLHDLHVCAMGTDATAATAHLVLADGGDSAAVLQAATRLLQQDHGIGHATLQLETRAYAATCKVRHGESIG